MWEFRKDNEVYRKNGGNTNSAFTDGNMEKGRRVREGGFIYVFLSVGTGGKDSLVVQ